MKNGKNSILVIEYITKWNKIKWKLRPDQYIVFGLKPNLLTEVSVELRFFEGHQAGLWTGPSPGSGERRE